MQKESRLRKYWQKDNFYKNNQSRNKSTISESVKGFCTNVWYKLGGQSMLTKRISSNFSNLVILGKKYDSYEEAQKDFKALFWFTYRKEVKINWEIKTDLGWGCLIRVGQMLLANGLKKFFQSKKSLTSQENIIFSFLDDSEGIRGKYSFQRILQKGNQKFELVAGDWFNISQICFVLMYLQNCTPMKGSQQFKMIYFNQTLIFLDRVFERIDVQICQCAQKRICCPICNGQINYRKKGKKQKCKLSNSYELQFEDLNLSDIQEFQLSESTQNDEKCEEQKKDESFSNEENKREIRFDLLLVVSTRISQSSVDQKNYEGMLELMNLPTSLGMIGGVPNKGLYFVGTSDQNLIYLDPHLVQNPVNTFNLSKQLQSFHCSDFRTIGRQKIDPSIAFAFYIRNLNELSELIEKIDKIKKKNPEAVPISYMWKDEFMDGEDFLPKSNEIDIDDNSPDFPFIA